jgi:hypothetical protein
MPRTETRGEKGWGHRGDEDEFKGLILMMDHVI